MTCTEIEKLIIDYLYNDMDAVMRSEFERHLHACPKCCRTIKEFQQVRGLFGQIGERELPKEAEVGILRRLQEASAQRSLREFLKSLTACPRMVEFGLAAALAISFVIYNYPTLIKISQPVKLSETQPSIQMQAPKTKSLEETAPIATGIIPLPAPAKQTDKQVEVQAAKSRDKILPAQEMPKENRVALKCDNEESKKSEVIVSKQQPSAPLVREIAADQIAFLKAVPAKEKQFPAESEAEAEVAAMRRAEKEPDLTETDNSQPAKKEAGEESRYRTQIAMDSTRLQRQRLEASRMMAESARSPQIFGYSAASKDSRGLEQNKMDLALAFVSQKDYRRAYEQYKEIILTGTQTSDRLTAWNGLKDCTHQLKNYQEALDFIQQYLKDHTDIDNRQYIDAIAVDFASSLNPPSVK